MKLFLEKLSKIITINIDEKRIPGVNNEFSLLFEVVENKFIFDITN